MSEQGRSLAYDGRRGMNNVHKLTTQKEDFHWIRGMNNKNRDDKHEYRGK